LLGLLFWGQLISPQAIPSHISNCFNCVLGVLWYGQKARTNPALTNAVNRHIGNSSGQDTQVASVWTAARAVALLA